MTTDDLPEFTALLDSVCALLSRGQYTPNDVATALWFRALAPYPLAVVRAAFDVHVRTSRFPPTPAEILEVIGGNDGRPGPEEAWGECLRGRDERVTVVWTDEMKTAWAAARAVLAAGDEVGARMAFRETYSRAVELARRAAQPVHWSVAIGHDRHLAAEAVRAAVLQGRLTLPVLGDEVMALLEHEARPSLPAPEAADTEEARKGLAALAALAERMRNPPPSKDLLDKQATAAAAAQARERVEQYAAEHGLDMAETARKDAA